MPCPPGRPTVGLCAHYGGRGPVAGVSSSATLNGGSRSGEDDWALALAEKYGYRGIGGSDAHIVSHIGRNATRFERPIQTIDDLVAELKEGTFEAVTCT